MNYIEKKLKLIEELIKERKSFADRQHDTTNHDMAIAWLRFDVTPSNPEQYELLDAVMNDFETVCSDYNLK